MAEQLYLVGADVVPERLAHPALKFIHAYWDRKRGSRAMPERATIVPSELREHLAWIVMTDVQPEFADFRYRLVGTLVNKYFGVDVTGQTVRSAFADAPEAVLKAALALHRKCARDRIPVLASGTSNWMEGGYEEFVSLYLPLSDDGAACNVVLNVFVFDRDKVLLSRGIAKANRSLAESAPKTGT
jgi:hypothetical protein